MVTCIMQDWPLSHTAIFSFPSQVIAFILQVSEQEINASLLSHSTVGLSDNAVVDENAIL